MRFLTNQEKFKTVLLNGYLQKRQSVQDLSYNEKRLDPSNIGKCLKNRLAVENEIEEAVHEWVPVYEKRRFCPFKEERDHLGRLIDSVSFKIV